MVQTPVLQRNSASAFRPFVVWKRVCSVRSMPFRLLCISLRCLVYLTHCSNRCVGVCFEELQWHSSLSILPPFQIIPQTIIVILAFTWSRRLTNSLFHFSETEHSGGWIRGIILSFATSLVSGIRFFAFHLRKLWARRHRLMVEGETFFPATEIRAFGLIFGFLRE
ncbi:hypothetical protein B0T25DRAFT_533567 [Lasiosphaeria hispida]|uniref:Uncharacterized protein n=1 Tax=Lasiosphaeria hispida TaxID=260671 RepID=A0AAJ0HR11_9PEZI|nr:hypothetical protein B0T25DRAFT_533567 [Lasiosphaeria hispida]